MSYMQAIVVLQGRDWPSAYVDRTDCRVETAEVLTAFLSQSNQLGGVLVDTFWDRLAACHTQLDLNGKMY
jgi:hypothetical protein